MFRICRPKLMCGMVTLGDSTGAMATALRRHDVIDGIDKTIDLVATSACPPCFAMWAWHLSPDLSDIGTAQGATAGLPSRGRWVFDEVTRASWETLVVHRA